MESESEGHTFYCRVQTTYTLLTYGVGSYDDKRCGLEVLGTTEYLPVSCTFPAHRVDTRIQPHGRNILEGGVITRFGVDPTERR